MKIETRFFFVLDFIDIKWDENLFQYSQLIKNMLIELRDQICVVREQILASLFSMKAR